MSEENVMEVPMLTISAEETERNKQELEKAKAILTPPEGQLLAGMRAYCPVHGDITRASKVVKHTIYVKSEETGEVKPRSYSDVICLACVSEFWRKQIVANYPKNADGTPGDIKVAPVFISEEEYKEMLKQQEEAAAQEAKSSEEEKVEN